jgi:hypothetical protein
MLSNKDKNPWVPKTMFLLCMAVALGFFVVGVML